MQGKVIKSLTLPGSVAESLEQVANKTGCKQADIVKVAICEISNLDDEQLNKKLVKYQIY